MKCFNKWLKKHLTLYGCEAHNANCHTFYAPMNIKRQTKQALRPFNVIRILMLSLAIVSTCAAELSEPEIYVPFQDLPSLIDPSNKAILMDRAQFESLLSASRELGQEGLKLGQISKAQYAAQVQNENVTLTASMEVISMSKEPVMIPLAFAQLGLNKVILDGKPAPLGYNKQGRLVLIVTSQGTHALEIEAKVKLQELSSGGMQFSISIPESVAGSMALTTPGDMEIHSTSPISSTKYDKNSDQTRAELVIGGQNKLTVVLMGNGRQEDNKAILLGESASIVKLTKADQNLDCLYTVQVLRRGVRQLQFHLSGEWTITQVTCPNLVKWSIDKNASAQELKTLTVRLGSAKTGTVALHIQADAARDNQKWHSPRIELADADAERGYLMVNTDETLGVRGETLSAVRREDISAAAFVTGLDVNHGGRLYFHWGKDWSVNLDLEEVTLRKSNKEQQRIVISTQQVTLTGDFEVTAVERELFNMTFFLRGLSDQWQIRNVLVNSQQAGFDYRTQKEGDRELLRIELKQPVQPEKTVNVTIVLQNMPRNWDWPSNASPREISVPLIESRAETVSGYVSISALGDLDASAKNVPTKLEEVPVARMVTLGMENQIQYAYSYNAPTQGQIALEVSRRQPRQSSESVGLVNVTPETFSGDWRMTYTISRASDKKLFMLADKSIGKELLITSPTVQIISKSIVASDSLPFGIANNLAQEYDIWQLNLDRSIMGGIIINVHYDRPVKANKFAIPLVRPLCDGQINEHLAIQASEELALAITPAGAKEIDAIDLPPLPVRANRIIASYQLESPMVAEGTNSAISLETSVHTGYAIPTALAVSANLITYLDTQLWQQSECNLQVANASRQFLTFRLPEGSELWSLSVNNSQAKPQRSTEGDYQVSLGRLGETVNVRIVYNYHPKNSSFDNAKLGAVEFPGLKINQLSWNVVPPPDYRITSQKTNMQTLNISRQRPAFLELYDYLMKFPYSGIFAPARLKTALYDKSQAVNANIQASGGDMRDEYGRTDSRSGTTGNRSGRSAVPPPAARGRGAAPVTTKTPRLQEEQDRMYFRQQVDQGRMAQQAQRGADINIQGDESRIPYSDQVTYPQNWIELQQRRTGGTLIAEGRYTLPVNLLPTPGAGQSARFSGLGANELVIGLTKQSKQGNAWITGFILMTVIGIASLMKKMKLNPAALLSILVIMSFISVWWPSMTSFANGIFWSALFLILLSISISIVRLVLKRTDRVENNHAVTAAMILIFCSILTGTNAAAQSANTALSTQNSSRVIIPYDTTPEKAGTSDKVLVPYSRFVELWNRVHPQEPIDKPMPGTDISLADVKYDVTITNEQFNLTLTTEIHTFGKEWVTLGLPVSGLAVTEAVFNGKTAQLQSGPKGMILMLPGDSSGTLRIKAVAKPQYLGQMGSIRISLPPLPAAVMNVILPQDDLELEVDGIESSVYKHQTGGKNEWSLALGMSRELTMRWLPKLGGGQASGTLSANSVHDVYAFHWSLIGVSKITYSFAGGERDRFTILVPKDAALTDLTGTNVRDYRQLGETSLDGKSFKIIEARLHRPAKKQYELSVKWLSAIPSLDKAGELQLIRAGDVSRESGTVTLYSAGGMGIKVAEVTGGRRTSLVQISESQTADRGSRNESSDRAQAQSSYYWPYRPFSLSIQLSRLQAIPKVNLDQLVRINTDRVELLVQAKLSAEQGELFDASFALPKNYELLSVIGPAVKDFYERPNSNGNFVHVEFDSGRIETTVALVLVQENSPPQDFNVPTITYIDSVGHEAAKQEGRLAVQVAPSFDAHTISSENLTGVRTQTLQNWLPRQFNLVQYAYQYEEPNPSLRLNVSKKPARIQAEVFAGLVLKTTSASYTYRLRYNIAQDGSPVDHLSFRLPSQYASLAAVSAGGGLRNLTRSESNDGLTSWTVSLLNEVTGIVDVAVNFTLPIETSTSSLSIPRVETDSPEGHHTIIAVQNMSRHEIKIQDSNSLTVLSVGEQQALMPAQMRESLQYVYQSFEPNWKLSLGLTQAKPAARIQAVVDLLALTTVINRDGRCRYEVKVELQNRSEQFLHVEAPKGLNLWSASVAGQPVKPVRDINSPAGHVLIPLVKTSPGGLPYEIVLYFADEGDKPLVKPLEGISRLKPPGISIVGIPVTRTIWSLHLPEGFRYVRPGGNMSPVAGIAEMLILSNEAKLEQLKRLEQSYRDLAVKGNYSQIENARSNYDAFNRKLSSDIQQTEKYIASNGYQMGREEADRLRSSVQFQQERQNVVIEGNNEFLEKQRQQERNDMNIYLNGSISNAGVAESVRNSGMNQMPGFVTENEKQQFDRLNKELRESNQVMLDYKRTETAAKPDTASSLKVPTQSQGKAADDLISGQSDKDNKMAGILSELSKDADSTAAQKQKQLQQQLSQMRDNRLQRYTQSQNEESFAVNAPPANATSPAQTEQPQPQRQGGMMGGFSSGGVMGGRGARGGFDGGGGMAARGPGGAVSAERENGLQAPADQQNGQNSTVRRFDINGTASQSSTVVPQAVQAYTAQNVYSLPVSLPSGSEVQLDFARSSGDAELSILAVPDRTISKFVTTLVIAGLSLLIFVILKLWPKYITKRSLSKRAIIIYVVLAVCLLLLFGAIGLLASLLIVLLNEGRHTVFSA